MCQAFAGEQAYMMAHDKSVRLRGYEARKAGAPRDKCAEAEHDLEEYSDANQWRMGWDTAESGGEAW